MYIYVGNFGPDKIARRDSLFGIERTHWTTGVINANVSIGVPIKPRLRSQPT